MVGGCTGLCPSKQVYTEVNGAVCTYFRLYCDNMEYGSICMDYCYDYYYYYSYDLGLLYGLLHCCTFYLCGHGKVDTIFLLWDIDCPHKKRTGMWMMRVK